MTMARHQFTVTDEAGNVVPFANFEVRKELPGAALAALKDGRDGTDGISNPGMANADGDVFFHVVGGAYKIRVWTGPSGAPTFEKIWRYVAIGTASEYDAEAFAPATAIREKLTANRTYYVRDDGSDSNNGLADTSGGAFLTITKALSTVYALDLTTFNVTIVLTGTFSEGVTLNAPFLGSGTVTIDGGGTAFINRSSGTVISANNKVAIRFRRLKIASATGGFGIYAQNGASVTVLDGFEFGAFGTSFEAHVVASLGASVQFFNPYKISGSAYNHMYCLLGGSITADGVTVTLTGTPAFAGGYVRAYKLGSIEYYGATFSGSATGPRYSSSANSVIDTAGGGASYFPGNSVGSTATGGLYL